MTGLAGASPRDVVPGDPAAADELATALRTYAGGAAENAAQLRGAGDGRWVGEAADAFRGKLAELPDKLERGVDAFVSASNALGVYAEALRDGQAKAAQAIELAQDAERRHAAWQRQVAAYNQAVEAGAVPEHRPPETSPGAAVMAGAERLVGRAVGPVEDAADKAAAVLREGAAQAPDTSSLVGDVIRGYWHHTKQFWIGAGEATWGLGEFVFTHSNVYALIDPEGYVENMTSLAQGLIWGAQHPVEFGKAIIDWETWKTNPSRAMGHLLPDAILTAATAGAGGAGLAASRGASAASRLSRAADDVADIAEDMEDVGDAARASDRTTQGIPSESVPDPLVRDEPLNPKKLEEPFRGENDPDNPNRRFYPDTVHYMSPDELEAHRVVVVEGKLYRSDGSVFDTSNAMTHHSGSGRAMYVMDPHGNLYASNVQRVGQLHHSSFLSGEDVAGAGEIVVENGRVVLVSRKSGHYLPPAEYQQQVREILAKQGLDVSKITFEDGF